MVPLFWDTLYIPKRGGVVAQWSTRQTVNATMQTAHWVVGSRLAPAAPCLLGKETLPNFPTSSDESMNRGLVHERMHTILHTLKTPTYPSEE